MYTQVDMIQRYYDEAVDILEKNNSDYINEQNPMYQHFMACMLAEEIKLIVSWY